MLRFDVVIVGAGPAGLSTALSLIQLDPGWSDRMVVLEKRAHPRHKLCAGGLTPFGLAQLRRLGLALDIPMIYVETARFEYRGRAVGVRGAPAIVVTQRQEFDAWLANHARRRGVAILENCHAVKLERHTDGILVHTQADTFHAQALVGADGSRGMVRGWIDARESPPRVARLLEIVTPASGLEPEYTERVDRFDFSLLRRNLQGYYWDFPSLVAAKPYMNRGLYDSRLVASRRRAELPRLLIERLQSSNPEINQPDFEGHPIHRFSPRNHFSAPNVLLVGDAAGADPLFGEGISVALGYGEVAAQTLNRAFSRQIFSFHDYRHQLLSSRVGRYLLLRWHIAWWSYRLSRWDLFMRLLWRVAKLLTRVLGPLPEVPGVVPSPPPRSGRTGFRT